jgi:hypothetical protein
VALAALWATKGVVVGMAMLSRYAWPARRADDHRASPGGRVGGLRESPALLGTQFRKPGPPWPATDLRTKIDATHQCWVTNAGGQFARPAIALIGAAVLGRCTSRCASRTARRAAVLRTRAYEPLARALRAGRASRGAQAG